MNDSQWENLIYKIEERFGINERYTEDVVINESSSGQKIMGKLETIEFSSPLGKMKLARTTRPRVLDKKTAYSRRIGGRVAVDYVYSDDQTVSRVKAYKQDEQGQWQEIDISAFK